MPNDKNPHESAFSPMDRIEEFCNRWNARTYDEFLRKSAEKSPSLREYALDDPDGTKRQKIKIICRQINRRDWHARHKSEPQRPMLDQILDYCVHNDIFDYDILIARLTKDHPQLAAYAKGKAKGRHRDIIGVLAEAGLVYQKNMIEFWHDLGIPTDEYGDPIGIG